MRRRRTPWTSSGWERDVRLALRGRMGPEWQRRAEQVVWAPGPWESAMTRWRELRTPSGGSPNRPFQLIVAGLLALAALVCVGVALGDWLTR